MGTIWRRDVRAVWRRLRGAHIKGHVDNETRDLHRLNKYALPAGRACDGDMVKELEEIRKKGHVEKLTVIASDALLMDHEPQSQKKLCCLEPG